MKAISHINDMLNENTEQASAQLNWNQISASFWGFLAMLVRN